ncbi:hypothetical protein predicted by Glimmer/Critica [Sorangium cellulosum So ce56]|uniref:Uncharacterized protein n=1 Tax=Sorangium cellulosum (strain So ce56) TaxID=448385 RepID=A9GJK0_SORC5|nr:hypothetical protein [Sorangium cellulosum]CAN96453.1 hypothetical protein predicted by Glimmer/Critica [Sorangium cellulosum So ce56]
MFLPDDTFTFNHPPLNSSGDIYHTVALLLVLKHLGLPLPKVRVGYFDVPDGCFKTEGKLKATELHATRATSFASALGFDAQVQMIKVNLPRCVRINSRLKATREAIFREDSSAKVLDQKVSTGLLALIADHLGSTAVTDIIRTGFTTYASPLTTQLDAASKRWLDDEYEKVRKHAAPDAQIVIFHERLADNQNQNNSTGRAFDAIRKKIKALANVRQFTFRAGPAPTSWPNSSRSRAYGDCDETCSKGLTEHCVHQVRYLQLLARLKRELITHDGGSRFLGIYGSSSGTLDAPSFMGLRALSFHQFADGPHGRNESRRDTVRNAQDQREALMSCFKSVAAKTQRHKDAADIFAQWMAGSYEGLKLVATPSVDRVYTQVHTRPRKGRRSREVAKDIAGIDKKLCTLLRRCLTR